MITTLVGSSAPDPRDWPALAAQLVDPAQAPTPVPAVRIAVTIKPAWNWPGWPGQATFTPGSLTQNIVWQVLQDPEPPR